MSINKSLLIFFVSLIIFLVVDGIWLGFIAKNMYSQKIGHLLGDKPNLIAAGVFYIIFIIGLTAIVTIPSLRSNSFASALMLGALFGLVSYSTYDLTNLATLKNWPIDVTIIDMIWGTFVSSLVSSITFLIFK
jgi:uncharacterized membrane protein